MSERDWYQWHAPYDDPNSALARRLNMVQERIREVLDGSAPGPLRVVSICAGQGHDLLGVLATNPRRADVRAILVELDPRNVAVARRTARATGLANVTVIDGDAADTTQYADAAPADLVLACGVFGNISDTDVEATIGYCTQLCAAGGTVIWTRHRRNPDLVPRICGWFDRHGFELSWLSDTSEPFGVGAHRFTGTPQPLLTGRRMFTFVDAAS